MPQNPITIAPEDCETWPDVLALLIQELSLAGKLTPAMTLRLTHARKRVERIERERTTHLRLVPPRTSQETDD